MRAYSVATAALALDVDPKWLDNLLSQNRVENVTQARQGVPRRLAPAALHVIATVHALNRELQVPVASALRIAHELWSDPPDQAPGDHAALQAGEVILHLDRTSIRQRVDRALAEALEIAPRTKRGRPPRRT